MRRFNNFLKICFVKELLISCTFLFFIYSTTSAQSSQRRNSVNVNITRLAINEVNLGYEHFLSSRKSMELSGGIVYVNEGLESASENWTNTKYFSEHGFALRLHYKIYRPHTDNSKWTEYISFGGHFRYLYYNTQWFSNEKVDSHENVYHELILQNRFRDKFSLEFLWGKILNVSEGFAIEIYYGAGLSGTKVL